MTRKARWSALLGNDLRYWMTRRAFPLSLGLAVIVLGLKLASGGRQGSLFAAALGGPMVAVVGGRLAAGPGWTGFVISVLFVVACLSMLDTQVGWIDLTVVRDASQRRWATARLAALALGALIFLAALTGVMVLAVVLTWRAGPVVTATSVWDVGVWALDLISLGWFALVLELLTGTPWWSFAGTLFVLSIARFGGGLAPYMPFAQWIIALHGLPGTLSIRTGGLYLTGFTLLAGITVLWAAPRRRR